MKFEKNGIVYDPDKDEPMCGTMGNGGEMTLYRTKEDKFYTHIIDLNKENKISGEKIELHSAYEAALILTEFGFSEETIGEETGYKILPEKLQKHSRRQEQSLSS